MARSRKRGKMASPRTSPSVVVTGDFVLDHHIYEGKRHHFGDRRSHGVQQVIELGGAALVHYLLAELEPVESHLAVAIDERRQPPGAASAIPDELKAYAFWRPFLRKEKDPESAVWRTSEAMGFGGQPAAESGFVWPKTKPQPADVVVISEGGMGFRRDKSRWPAASVLNQARWIVLKTAYPLAGGALWKALTQPAYRDKLVVIVAAHELRKTTAQIGTGLSWEQTLESVFSALEPDGALAELTRCRHLIVAFESDGGLWLDQGKSAASRQAHLVYEAAATEGEFRSTCKGNSFGMLSCLTAAVAWRLALEGARPDLEAALEGGLSAMRDLLDSGHGRAAAAPAGFPGKRLAKVIKDATCRYARATFPLSAAHAVPTCGLKSPPEGPARCWSLLHEALRGLGQGCPNPAWQLAELVARRGPIALGSLPHLGIGGLLSADRQEIESLRILRHMIRDYSNSHDPARDRKPLSIGVFGPPGAGKSFAVKQIAKALLGDDGWMEFNLSQFKEGTDDLIGAFHQIRDRALKGILPVTFFDEFDSREYRWLQYLLAPMQDGAFQEGQITHPIGKCIVILAGGTSHTFDTFGPPKGDAEAQAHFRLSKGPDFKSRLDGFLDVLGPNQRLLLSLSKDATHYEPKLDPCDIFFPIRRAFILRSELGLSATDKLEIDQGLLRALLRVSEYRYGARSLGKLLEPLKAVRPAFLNRSLTPPRSQLALHVDADRFLALCREGQAAAAPVAPFDDTTLDKVAEAIHETFRALGRAAGWLDEKNDPDFKDLSEFLKESNRAAANRVAETLGMIGLALVPGRATAKEVAHVRLKIEYHLELLAEAEHNGWMTWYLDQGWQWGPTKSEEKKTHPCLKPYALLPDEERNKDRNTVRHYLDFAKEANMSIAIAAAKR